MLRAMELWDIGVLLGGDIDNDPVPMMMIGREHSPDGRAIEVD